MSVFVSLSMCVSACVPTGVDDCGAYREAVHEPASVGTWGRGDPLFRYEREEENF